MSERAFWMVDELMSGYNFEVGRLHPAKSHAQKKHNYKLNLLTRHLNNRDGCSFVIFLIFLFTERVHGTSLSIF